MNILLIYPAFPDTFWSFSYALRFIGKKSAFPPLGLITVAALLPATWSLRLVDVNVDDLTDDDLAWADMAFLSAMAVQRKSAAVIIARCHGKGLRIVAGGPLFTAEPEAFGQVNHLVLDEAEAYAAGISYGSEKRMPETTLPSKRLSRNTHADPYSVVGHLIDMSLCIVEHSVLQRVPIQLRVLQYHGSLFGTHAAHQNAAAGSC
jgi:radical SAM superfamily enzyme YgiQ (UPF0313 family)